MKIKGFLPEVYEFFWVKYPSGETTEKSKERLHCGGTILIHHKIVTVRVCLLLQGKSSLWAEDAKFNGSRLAKTNNEMMKIPKNPNIPFMNC